MEQTDWHDSEEHKFARELAGALDKRGAARARRRR